VYYVALLADIEHYAQLTEKVIEQIHQMVVLGQKVATADKIVIVLLQAISIIHINLF
jgi:hypothetical protein